MESPHKQAIFNKETDMNLDDLVPTTSKYLAKEDVGTGMNLTIAGFKRQTVGQGADADERAVMYFKEDVKPMVLNKTNKNRLKHYLGGNTTEQVIGAVINVYNDPDIEFGGEIVGGLRIRAKVEEQKIAPPRMDDFDDDSIPF